MVRIPLLHKKMEAAAAAVAVAIPVLPAVSVQDGMARAQTEFRGLLQAVQGPPDDDASIGEIGLTADALIQWGEVEPGMRINDYSISKGEHMIQRYEASIDRHAWLAQWRRPPGTPSC